MNRTHHYQNKIWPYFFEALEVTQFVGSVAYNSFTNTKLNGEIVNMGMPH